MQLAAKHFLQHSGKTIRSPRIAVDTTQEKKICFNKEKDTLVSDLNEGDFPDGLFFKHAYVDRCEQRSLG